MFSPIPVAIWRKENTCSWCEGNGYIVSADFPGWKQEKWICEYCGGTGENIKEDI